MSIELEIENIVDSILEDYQKERSIDKMDVFSQVDKEVIIDIIDKLVKIIYPGFSHVFKACQLTWFLRNEYNKKDFRGKKICKRLLITSNN